jgi:hypothetical protein
MDRTALIRKGNELFNSVRERWDYDTLKSAAEHFSAAEYQDGLLRVADWLYYDKRLPLLALSFYRKVPTSTANSRIGEIHQRMVLAIRALLKQP